MGQALYLEGGVPKASSVSKAELEYLSGVTSGVQSQLNNKMPNVTPGTSGNVLKSNGTTWVSSAPSGGGTGTGAYTTPGRALATTYTNTGSTTRWVLVSAYSNGNFNPFMQGFVDGSSVVKQQFYNQSSTYYVQAGFTFPVPPGATYSVTGGGGSFTVDIWKEYQ